MKKNVIKIVKFQRGRGDGLSEKGGWLVCTMCFWEAQGIEESHLTLIPANVTVKLQCKSI